jgi:hypothetical protein
MSKQYNNALTVKADLLQELDFTPPSTYYWNVTQVTVSSNSSETTTCRLFVDQKYFCGTAVGNGDSADGSALIVNNGSRLRLVWSGAIQGDLITCSIQVEENQVGS